MKLPKAFTEENDLIHIVIETPRGSRNKYTYNHKNEFFELSKILPAGTGFPLDFGFVPQTEAQDGQPLDALVLMDHPSYPGCVVKCRCLGVIEAEQTEDGEKFRNDRIIAVADESLTFSELDSVDNLNKHLVDEVIHFFEYYNEMAGKKFKFLKLTDEEAAVELIKKHLIKK